MCSTRLTAIWIFRPPGRAWFNGTSSMPHSAPAACSRGLSHSPQVGSAGVYEPWREPAWWAGAAWVALIGISSPAVTRTDVEIVSAFFTMFNLSERRPG
ncbi:hypothetical protein GCM10009668_13630 [Nocardioides dubius]|uniref:Uncharacterized protein n=1 Tax=Nocardioides dubius TaxID=317019 RepID=A0ABN1TT24_9ACTN